MKKSFICLSLLLASHQLLAANQQNEAEIEVVSITASKQALSVNRTPDSVSVVLLNDIMRTGPQHINQALAQIPGTWISRGNGQEHLSAIRSPVLTGAGSCGAFFMGIDGISIRAPGFCNANQLFDINYEQASRVDVLRSPASTLYGGNALHGVINLITQDAFAYAGNSVSLQLGAYDFARLSGVYGQQKGDSAWLTLANVTQENGFQTQSGYDQQKLTTIYQSKGDTWRNKTLIDMSNLNQETAGFIQGFESYKDDSIRRSNPNPEAYRDTKSLRAYSAFSRSTRAGELTLTPYIRANQMAFLQHFLPWKALEENSHSSLGMQTQLAFKFKQIEWISGFDLDFTQGKLTETQADPFSPNIPAGVHYDYTVNASQIALYAQGLWSHENWQIRFGARAESNRYDYNNLTNSNSACASTVSVCRFTRPDDQNVSFDAISPSINLQYQLNANTLWYAKYAQGFRAPQATELFRLQNNQQVTDIDNENMDAFESGLRWQQKGMRLHAAAFHMLKKDVIFQNSDRQNVTGAQTQHQGVEIEAGYAITNTLSVNGHISYAEHTYQNNTAQVASNIKGNLIDTAPKWMSQVNVRYQVSDSLDASLSWQYLSKYYLNPENTAQYDGHQLLDLHMNYYLKQGVTLSLHMLNLSNEDYAERADFAFGNHRYFVGQPRRAFINLQWLF